MLVVRNVLHNLRDHIGVLRAIHEHDAATGEARDRLLSHIAFEEQENQRLLAEALKVAPASEHRTIALALEHSRILCDIIDGSELSPGLARELLEHFQEEHDTGLLAPSDARPRLTVGDLRSSR